MPITQALNSKANVKKSTANDLPFAPQQPVISSYYATSTSAQTVINLTFSVDTTNTDIFFLFVDGKKLTLGSSADYTFTSVAADGTSSQVTLNQSLVSGLNIQAHKMGLKKESEFLTDNRFVSAYDYLDQSFQAFVAQNMFLTATSSTGTPASGKFYSSIQNRAPIVDLTQNLKAQMGVERIACQQYFQLQNEIGPNGEAVYGVYNDTYGQVRLVSGAPSVISDSGGQYVQLTTNTTDFIEITFYGTGLNALHRFDGTTPDYRVSVDGGAEAASSYIGANPSSIIASRNYSANQVTPVVSGLTLGVHTVKIRRNAGNFNFHGFEILNESAQVKVNPGVSYLKGQKYVSSAQSLFSYSSVVTGIRGGRVLVYQKSDGSIGQAFQAVNSAAAYLTSADHTNEEMVRSYNWREFGAGRSDDLGSMTASSGANVAFTLDDGVTTLGGNSLGTANQTSLYNSASGSWTYFTFIGTGLDILRQDPGNGAADTTTVFIDGVSVGNLNLTATTNKRIEKIVSGLPYGSHVVKFVRSTFAANAPGIIAFNVHQPKKPSLPSGCVELADYNVMATYVANTSTGIGPISSGVLRKMSNREFTYVGTWSAPGVDTLNFASGNNFNTGSASSYFTYTFFGTGADLRFLAQSVACNATVSLDGSTNIAGSGAFTSLNASGTTSTFNSSTGALVLSTSSGNVPVSLSITGLSLGLHTLKVTYNSGNNLFADAIDIITPIHSVKSNLYGDLQNTLTVGSCAISDNRKTTPTKDALPAQKAWAQALATGGTTTSTSPVPMPGLSVTLKTSGGRVKASFAGMVYNNAGGGAIITTIYVNGVQAGGYNYPQSASAGYNEATCNVWTGLLPAGTHKIDVYWYVNTSTGNVAANYAALVVEEV
jgi:hypothetical protein